MDSKKTVFRISKSSPIVKDTGITIIVCIISTRRANINSRISDFQLFQKDDKNLQYYGHSATAALRDGIVLSTGKQ